jgi:hypothetical protein
MHTSTYKGKRVRIKLKDGTVFVDKFLDEKGKHIIFEEHGRVPKIDVINFSIYKNKSSRDIDE